MLDLEEWSRHLRNGPIVDCCGVYVTLLWCEYWVVCYRSNRGATYGVCLTGERLLWQYLNALYYRVTSLWQRFHAHTQQREVNWSMIAYPNSA
jgi:hypothetical protein